MRFLSKPLIIADGQGDDVMVVPSSRTAGRFTADQPIFSLTQSTGHPLDALVQETLDLVSLSFVGAGLIEEDCFAHYAGHLIPGDANARLMVDGLSPTLYLPDFNLNAVAIARSTHFSSAFMFQLIKGLRAITQVEYRALNVTLCPDDMIRWGRLMEADRNAYAVLIAYDLRDLAPTLWRYVLGSEYGDIAVRIAQEFDRLSDAEYEDVDILNRALMLWFRETSRVNACDRVMLDYIDAGLMARESDVTPVYEHLTADMIGQLCVLDDGTSYITDKMRSIFASWIKNVMTDPINAAHLAQIIRDSQSIIVQNVPFRDAALARKIFPT